MTFDAQGAQGSGTEPDSQMQVLSLQDLDELPYAGAALALDAWSVHSPACNTARDAAWSTLSKSCFGQ